MKKNCRRTHPPMEMRRNAGRISYYLDLLGDGKATRSTEAIRRVGYHAENTSIQAQNLYWFDLHR